MIGDLNDTSIYVPNEKVGLDFNEGEVNKDSFPKDPFVFKTYRNGGEVFPCDFIDKDTLDSKVDQIILFNKSTTTLKNSSDFS